MLGLLNIMTRKGYTALKIAQESGMPYIADIKPITTFSRPDANYFWLTEGKDGKKYIPFYPAVDGKATKPFVYRHEFDDGIRPAANVKVVMTNQDAYCNITNLDEILLQMVGLYIKYIDTDALIVPTLFALRLDDEIREGYQGRATLALMDMTVRNPKLKQDDDVSEVKKRFLNIFLDHFIGWNFGVVIKKSPQLEQALHALNELVISRGLREYAGNGLNVWTTDKVEHYSLKTE